MASVPERNESDYPAYWDWDRDGPANGTFLRMEEGRSAYGRRAILILRIDVERSIWIREMALRLKLRDELNRRGARNFTPGERIEIRRGTEKKTSASDREYWPFWVDFPDAPKSDAADLLGLATDDADSGESPAPLFRAVEEGDVPLDDEIPF